MEISVFDENCKAFLDANEGSQLFKEIKTKDFLNGLLCLLQSCSAQNNDDNNNNNTEINMTDMRNSSSVLSLS